MSSILSSQGVVLATVMAVSSTVILLSFCRQKTFSNTQFAPDQTSMPNHRILRSCISSDGKKRDRKKKRVHFADDVVDPTGNSKEFRRQQYSKSLRFDQAYYQSKSCRVEGIPANRMALYKGVLQDRVQRMACSY